MYSAYPPNLCWTSKLWGFSNKNWTNEGLCLVCSTEILHAQCTKNTNKCNTRKKRDICRNRNHTYPDKHNTSLPKQTVDVGGLLWEKVDEEGGQGPGGGVWNRVGIHFDLLPLWIYALGCLIWWLWGSWWPETPCSPPWCYWIECHWQHGAISEVWQLSWTSSR